MTTEAKVGTFVLAGMVFMAVAIFLLGDFTFEKRYTLFVRFSDVASLTKSAPVKLSGVDIGQITDIILDGSTAKVVASVKRGVDIYRNAQFEIGSTGIIGSKFLQITQGTADTGILEPGAAVRGIDPVALDKAMTTALKSLDELLAGLNGQGKPGSMGRNLNDTVANVREMTANLNDLIETSSPHLQEAMTRMDGITEKLDSLLVKSNQMMAGLATDKGAVGALLHDDKVKQDVKEAVHDLKEVAGTAKDVFGRVNQFRIFWNYDWRYEHAIRTSRADAGLKIVPRDGRYYYIGGSNMMNISDQRRSTVDYAQANRADVLMGFEFEKWGGKLDMAVGAIRSGGGARVTVTPFNNHPVGQKFSVMAQGYDFSRNRTIESRKFTRPVWDFGFMARFNRFIGIGGRVEDVKEIKRYQSWLNITFEDKDIAYLFGVAAFGASGTKGRSKSK